MSGLRSGLRVALTLALSLALLAAATAVSAEPWPPWALRFVLIAGGIWLFDSIRGLISRAEARAQRRTDALVGMCDAVKGVATYLQSGAERLAPDEAARVLVDARERLRRDRNDWSKS